MRWGSLLFAGLFTLSAQAQDAIDPDLGLVVQPERRCSPYRSEFYPYPQSVEPLIVRRQGGLFSPYSLSCFRSRRQTDIEHIVARSEAHDSGLCRAPAEVRRAFARDPDNLTLASPELNRRQKIAHDAAAWLPAHNRCWYAATVVRVKRKYGLSVDRAEARALRAVLRQCSSVAMTRPACARR